MAQAVAGPNHNLLGLMVTMSKDLPVWRAERRGEPET